MDGKLKLSPNLGYLDDSDDVKYVSKLSTILVATIQEAKDRISQIEYIFCSQLFSHFQSKTKSLHKIYLEAKKEAENSWKEKEKDLLLQIEKLQLQNQEALEEIRCLKLEKEKALVDLDEKINPLLSKEMIQQERIDKLENEVRNKNKEVDEGLELHKKLLQLVQSNSYMIVDKTKQLKEQEEKTNELLARVKKLEQKNEELEAEVMKKTEMVAEKGELAQNLYIKVESVTAALAKNGESVAQHEKEKKELVEKLEVLESNICVLQEQVRNKSEEYEEIKVVKEQLLQQIDVNNKKILKLKEQLEEADSGRKMLLQKSNGLEEKLNELKCNLSRSSTVAGKDSYETLLQKIQLKESQLQALKTKTKQTTGAYKRLKSQYNFLCNKFGLTEENMLLPVKLEDESVSLTHHQNPETAPDSCKIKKLKIENEANDGVEGNQIAKSIPMSSFRSPSSNLTASKCPPKAKSVPVISKKRPASRWVDTRSLGCRDGPDPHDDFLNTPLECLRATANKATNEKGTRPDSSDDETQDVSALNPGNQKLELPVAAQKEFKYVEPVRKKAERDNLKGVECKQCKKFYDAVLPNGGNQGEQNLRCEHHEGVSRHRYKHAPPMTPEGFWNIGFESEM